MPSIDIKVIDANGNFVIGTDGLTVAGFNIANSTTEKTFTRGQILFKQTGGGVDTTVVAGQVAGIVINTVTLPANSGATAIDLYTGGRFDGKKIHNLQATATQTHLNSYATTNGFNNPFNMQYEKTFNFEISH